MSYDLTNLAVKMVCPNNEVVLDDKNLPSIMVRIPKFKLSDVITGAPESVHPAFIINGVEQNEILIGKYQAVTSDGRAYSLPAQDPSAWVDHDTAKSRCDNKGNGFHLMTAAEWGAIALWCKKNGTIPKGNNNYGKDTSESVRSAIPTYYDGSTICRVATGTGGVEWSHDKTPNGIWDLNGNVWEWVAGIRFVYGELQVLENNNAADKNNSTGASSSSWKCINGATGEYMTPNGSGTTAGSVKMAKGSNGAVVWSTTMSNQVDSWADCSFASITRDSSISDAAYWKLVALAICPVAGDTSYDSDRYYFNNGAAERCCYRGGAWDNGAAAGVFAFACNLPRSYSSANVGFRVALKR